MYALESGFHTVGRRLRQIGLSALLCLGMTGALLLGTGTAAHAACSAFEKQVPSQSFVMVASSDNRTIYQFKTTQVSNRPAVVTYLNGRFLNTYWVPAGFNGNTVYVYTKLRLVTETWNGKVRQVQKAVTYVQACSPQWRII